MQKKSIFLKINTFTIPVLYIRKTKINIIIQEILEKISQSKKFFEITPVLLNISEFSSTLNWEEFKNSIQSTGLLIAGVTGYIHENLKKIILKSGCLIFSESSIYKNFFYNNNDLYKKNIFKKKNNSKIESSYIINKPVRSGQKIYIPNTDLIIVNNVSAGAELISGGNIHIYGIMRGRALAGAFGDINKKIFCMRLFAELISIAGEYLVCEKIPKSNIGMMTEISLTKEKVLKIRNIF